jgi:ketosteroid isomerase-like protein
MSRKQIKIFPTSEDAEAAFYDAFERGDIAAMNTVWAQEEDLGPAVSGENPSILCIHPQGPRLVGFEAIRDSWTQIFANGMQLRVRITEGRQFIGQTLAVHSVHEMLSVSGDKSAAQAILATNVYLLTENGWRMIVHHASPAPEAEAPEDSSAAHTLH